MEHSMGHGMEHSIEPSLGFGSNLPEMLAVDLEQSNDIFQSRQLTAGPPAPGLADDGTKKRYSLPHSSSSSPGPVSPSEPTDASSDANSPPAINQKYSDIFAPLDYNPPKRDSISSSEYSADLEPPSISTRGGSVLTIDTWLEPEKHPSPTLLHMSPTSDCNAQSWINLDVDELSPITQRRRSSMTDFPKYLQQIQNSNETDARTMSLKSQPIDVSQAPTTPIKRKPLSRPVEIPKRYSSLGHWGSQAAVQQWAQSLDQGNPYDGSPHFTPSTLPEASSAKEGDMGTSFLDDEATFALPDEVSRPSIGEGEGTVIASGEVNCDEWLRSDMAYLAREEQPLSRPLPPNIQERVELYVTNFPVTLLQCNHLLVDDIRGLSQGVRYNTEGLKAGQQANNQQQPKPSKWRWLGSSTSTVEQQDQFDTHPASSRQEWAVIRKVFPDGNDGLCDALYAYALVYNYITSLCLRSTTNPDEVCRWNAPWPARPDTSRLAAYTDQDLCSRPPSAHGAISKKASRILGIDEGTYIAPSPNATPPPTSGGVSRTSTFTSFRSIPSVFFNGMNQGQQRHGDSKSNASRPTTPATQRNSPSRPSTPVVGWAGMKSVTSLGSRGVDQGRYLAELRHGLAVCCARLTITLQNTDPNNTRSGSSENCKLVSSFMRSLCENVRFNEEVMARSH